MTHFLASEALHALQRCMRNDHQVVLLRRLQDVHQLDTLVYQCHRCYQIQRDKLAFILQQIITARPGKGRMLDDHIKTGILIETFTTGHIIAHELCLSRPLRSEHQSLGFRDTCATE